MGRPSALKPRPLGMTIGRWMAVAGVVGLVCWLTRADSWDSPTFRIVAGVLGGLLVGRMLILGLFGKRCPACGVGPLERVKYLPFGDHFYRCANCGQRAKRYALGRLYDASGPDDSGRFDPRPVSTFWDDSALDAEPGSAASPVVARLLRDKAGRHAEEAEPVSLDLLPEPPAGPAFPSKPIRPSGKGRVAETFFRTLETIRWARSSRR